jgi:hypothetical protein
MGTELVMFHLPLFTYFSSILIPEPFSFKDGFSCVSRMYHKLNIRRRIFKLNGC